MLRPQAFATNQLFDAACFVPALACITDTVTLQYDVYDVP